jgi:phosphoribosylformylglycinamidine synthase
VEATLKTNGVEIFNIGTVTNSDLFLLQTSMTILNFLQNIEIWFETSFLLDQKQTKNGKSLERYENFTNQLYTTFLSILMESLPVVSNTNRPKRQLFVKKGSNSEREMANAMYLAVLM